MALTEAVEAGSLWMVRVLLGRTSIRVRGPVVDMVLEAALIMVKGCKV